MSATTVRNCRYNLIITRRKCRHLQRASGVCSAVHRGLDACDLASISDLCRSGNHYPAVVLQEFADLFKIACAIADRDTYRWICIIRHITLPFAAFLSNLNAVQNQPAVDNHRSIVAVCDGICKILWDRPSTILGINTAGDVPTFHNSAGSVFQLIAQTVACAIFVFGYGKNRGFTHLGAAADADRAEDRCGVKSIAARAGLIGRCVWGCRFQTDRKRAVSACGVFDYERSLGKQTVCVRQTVLGRGIDIIQVVQLRSRIAEFSLTVVCKILLPALSAAAAKLVRHHRSRRADQFSLADSQIQEQTPQG